MTHEELCRARDAEDWGALWLEAEKVVSLVVGNMYCNNEVHNADREDVVQEGLLAAGSAIRSWEPIEGSFVTWISRIAKGHILNYLNKQSRVNLANADVENLPDGDAPQVDAPAERSCLRRLLDGLDLRERQFIERAYGIDCPQETHEQIARSKGLSRERVTQVIATALRKMGKA